jgi:hypothetical protein
MHGPAAVSDLHRRTTEQASQPLDVTSVHSTADCMAAWAHVHWLVLFVLYGGKAASTCSHLPQGERRPCMHVGPPS